MGSDFDVANIGMCIMYSILSADVPEWLGNWTPYKRYQVRIFVPVHVYTQLHPCERAFYSPRKGVLKSIGPGSLS